MPSIQNAFPDTDLTLGGTVVLYTCAEGHKFADGSVTQAVSCVAESWQMKHDACVGLYRVCALT